MDAERFTRLKAIVVQAHALEAGERAAFLDRACAGDDELRAEVESLLTHGDATPPILESGGLAASLHAALASRLPARIGPYVPLGVLGEGGMGIVYRAEQTTPVHREVALKVIRGELASAGVIARFEAERQTLARMDHPNIARMLDAGASADGPFFVMDLVRGVPITEFADMHGLPVDARLSLFLQVCDAVQHAHRKGVVHRDLKPSNLLVAEEDGRHLVKVIDFGIAKALEEAPGTTVTRAGLLVGTPDYMSPEQAGVLADADVDTRTDVFSLGVVLYELLAGRRPRSFRTGSPAEFQQVLGEGRPVAPPSAQAGDIGTIALKAIEVDPERRYQSVEQLADDVRRYLAGVPVLARPATWRYRSSRFLSRHRVAVAAAAVMVLAVAALTAVYTVRVARERDRARLEASKSAQVTAFLTELFEAADPDQAFGRDVSAQELLARGAQRIDRELGADPALQGTMMRVIGGVYHSLGAYPEAAPLLDGAVARHESQPGAELELAASLHARGSLAFAEGDYDRASALLRRALDLRRERLATPHPLLARTLEELGFIEAERTDLAAAGPVLLEAVAMARQLPDTTDDPGVLGAALTSLARLRLHEGNYAETQTLLREALAERRRVYGNDHSSVGTALDALAEALRREGKLVEAEEMFRESVAHARRILGDEHPTVSIRMANLVNVLQNQGKHAEALAMNTEVLARQRRQLGPRHTNVGTTLNTMLTIHNGLGDYAAAERAGREALDIQVEHFGDTNDAVASTLNNLALVVAERGDYDEAARLQRQAVAIDRTLLGGEHRYVGSGTAMVGTYLLAGGHVADAEAPLREGVEILRRTAGPDDRSTVTMLYNLGMFLVASGQLDEAEQVARDVVRMRRAALPAGHFEIGLAETLLGEVLAAQGRDAEAEPLLVGGFAMVKARPPGRHRSVARGRVVAFFESRGRPDRAAQVP
jgi:tetratricopeptide (TPR) repeat protein